MLNDPRQTVLALQDAPVWPGQPGTVQVSDLPAADGGHRRQRAAGNQEEMVSLAGLLACVLPLRVSLPSFAASPKLVGIARILFLSAPIHVSGAGR